MEYVKIFFVNTALLITLSYLANLIYKYTVTHASEPVKRVSWVLLAVFAGWISTFSATDCMSMSFLTCGMYR